MPVGGDVTQFSIGLMKVLGDSLRQGRIPLWNDLWGYGFPGLAESQMGVFYPPHLLLYGLLPVETAYTVSLVFHTLLAAFGTAWAARRLGISAQGACLAGFTWIASGFFVIHLPHQWGYSTAAWTPWAWGFAWMVVRGERPGRAALGLSAVLALQLLPGHFQIGFITQTTVVALFAVGFASRAIEGKDVRQRLGFAMAALLAIFPMAAIQLAPTFQLARLAEGRRDWDYLAGFALTPIHWVHYLAPGLFRRSPLWRPLAWDSFHTSPEESLGYVGLIPLFLALSAIRQGWRRDPRVTALLVLTGLTLALGLGPYFPGSRLLFRLPGFSFFRAPARWSVASGLALALLAGVGLDFWSICERPRRRLIAFVAACSVCLILAVLVVEGAFQATEAGGSASLRSVYEKGFAALPWNGDPSFSARMAQTRAPWNDFRALTALARQGVAAPTPADLTLSRNRSSILVQELAPTLAILGFLLLIVPIARRRGLAAGGLIVLTVVDLLILVRQQGPTDFGPIRPLAEQSPILAEMSSRSKGGRVVDGSRNLPMIVGVAPVSGYRTLDLPVAPELTALTREPLGRSNVDPLILESWRATGVGLRVLDPFEVRGLRRNLANLKGVRVSPPLRDTALAGWIHGEAWVAANPTWGAEFVSIEPESPPAQAWFFAGARLDELANTREPLKVLASFRDAQPLVIDRESPESSRVDFPSERAGVVVLSRLYHPGWSARLRGQGGERTARMASVFGGWQGVEVTEPGGVGLRLHYREPTLVPALAVSGLSWFVWMVLCVSERLRSRPGVIRPSDRERVEVGNRS